ncbi:uncharacterized protein VTP21DRAFT_8764 [Calcarisporiella thermophila]|uniref:uncharacterized protein n=1 Tax=Calcarisporiella thermophila TaxID=911321 RepID=UPI0037432833
MALWLLSLALILLPAAVQALWPLPRVWSQGQTTVELSGDFHFILTEDADPLLQKATQRYHNLILQEKFVNPVPDSWQQPGKTPSSETAAPASSDKHTTESITSVRVIVNTTQAGKYAIDSDESYQIDVPATGSEATIRAKTVWGAIRSLETFSQLVTYNKTSDSRVIRNAPWKIEDAPAYSHRGIMLDTSRNFFPVKDILRVLDGMAYSKLNVFHWHIVDSHSFPFGSERYPELWQKGAYGEDMVYTREDVRTILEHANERAIRVIPEIDMPGHTYSVGLSHPDLVTCMDMLPNWDKYAAEPPSGQLNPLHNGTLDLIGGLVQEVSEWFPDNVVHLGGDEIQPNCWKENPTVMQYMNSSGIADFNGVLQHFFEKVTGVARAAGKTPMTWEETVVSHNLQLGDIVVQVWNDPGYIKNITSRGLRVVASPHDYYYLDCGLGDFLGNQTDSVSWCDPYKTWQKVYSFDPRANLTEAEAKLVLGGEVAMWTELVDPSNLEVRLWPRSAAAGEVLWSNRQDQVTALYRLHEHRFRMLSRGIQSTPLQPLWCARNPGHCNAPFPK